jgi:hypothetical protein
LRGFILTYTCSMPFLTAASGSENSCLWHIRPGVASGCGHACCDSCCGAG